MWVCCYLPLETQCTVRSEVWVFFLPVWERSYHFCYLPCFFSFLQPLNEGSLSICLIPLKHFPLCCMFYLTSSSFNFISPIIFFSLLCCGFLLIVILFFPMIHWYYFKVPSVLFFLVILWRWDSPLCREAGVALEIFSWG